MGGPHETPKPLKNSHFHEENSPFSRAFPKTDFLEKSSWGSLKPARSQEASKRPARSQEEASKRPGRSQQEASKRPALAGGQEEAKKRPERCQEEAPNGGDPTKDRNH